MKLCPRCDVRKPRSEFYKNRARPDGLQTACKECSRAGNKSHYQRNSGMYLERNRRMTAEMVALVRERKSQPCADCGESYPYYVMHFDHLDEGEKEFHISDRRKYTATKRMLDEMEKCEVVCANCHAERTAVRAGYSVQPDSGARSSIG